MYGIDFTYSAGVVDLGRHAELGLQSRLGVSAGGATGRISSGVNCAADHGGCSIQLLNSRRLAVRNLFRTAATATDVDLAGGGKRAAPMYGVRFSDKCCLVFCG